jgi:hypothetical protein
VAGPFARNVVQAGPEKGVNLTATYSGKDGTKVGWRKLGADREGRLDLEAALGTRNAAAFLYAPVQSRTAQDGKLVVLLPRDAQLMGWINGKAVVFQPGAALTDSKAPVSAATPIALQAGKNEVLLKIVGGDQTALTLVVTLVSPQGVELAQAGK